MSIRVTRELREKMAKSAKTLSDNTKVKLRDLSNRLLSITTAVCTISEWFSFLLGTSFARLNLDMKYYLFLNSPTLAILIFLHNLFTFIIIIYHFLYMLYFIFLNKSNLNLCIFLEVKTLIET